MEYPVKFLLLLVRIVCATVLLIAEYAVYVVGAMLMFLWNPRTFKSNFRTFKEEFIDAPLFVTSDAILDSKTEHPMANGDTKVTRVYKYWVYQTPIDWLLCRKKYRYRVSNSVRPRQG